MAAICCQATNIPESFFLTAAEAVANSLDAEDMKFDRVVPDTGKIRLVGLNVATAVVLEAQKLGLAKRTLGQDQQEVEEAVRKMMWVPAGAEELNKKALTAKATPALARANTPEQLASKQLPVDADLDEHLHAVPPKYRALKISIDKKRPRFIEDGVIAGSSGFDIDMKEVEELLKPGEPCGVLLRLLNAQRAVPCEQHDHIMILWFPEGTPPGAKSVWSKAVASFSANFTDMRFKEWILTDKKEFQLDKIKEVAATIGK